MVKAMYGEFLVLVGIISFGKKTEVKASINQIFDDSGNFDTLHYVSAAGAQANRISRLI